MRGLVSYIADKLALPRENLATELLVHILRSARTLVLADLLKSFGMETSPSILLSIHLQKRALESGSIPDIQLQDRRGRTIAIIESKFQAGFTHNQPNSYLHEIGEGGLLVFVVPKVRQSPAFGRLLELSRTHTPPRHVRIDGSQPCRAIIDGRYFAVATWNQVFDTLEQSAGKHLSQHHQQQILGDIYQLRRFCDVAQKQTFPALTPQQVSGAEPSTLLRHFVWIAHELIDRCIVEHIIEPDQQAKNKHGLEMYAETDSESSIYFGRDLVIGGIRIWLGFYGSAWAELGTTPFWIEFVEDDLRIARVVNGLREAKGANFVVQHDLGSPEERTLIAIPLRSGVAQDEVVASAKDFLLDLKTLIEHSSGENLGTDGT